MDGSSVSSVEWYRGLLRKLERQYSHIFDKIVKDIMQSNDSSSTISSEKKQSLKRVLSFLFTLVCTDDNVNLFEKLYHHSVHQRIEAVRYLVKNMEKLCFSDDSKDLLKDSIAERLNDDSPLVVSEVLKFDTKNLKKIVGIEQLEKKLISVLESSLTEPQIWSTPGFLALKHLTSNDLCTAVNANTILITILPFLLQNVNFDFVRHILGSDLLKHIPFIRNCHSATRKEKNPEKIYEIISNQFELKSGLPETREILKYIQAMPDKDLTVSKAFYSMLVLGYSIQPKCPPSVSQDILETIERLKKADLNTKTLQLGENAQWLSTATSGYYPLNLNVCCIRNVLDQTDFSQLNAKQFDFVRPNAPLLLVQKIFEHLVAGRSSKAKNSPKAELTNHGLNCLVEKVFPNSTNSVEFFSNYFIVDVVPRKIPLASDLQVRAIEFFNSLIHPKKKSTGISLDLRSFIRILSSLRSKDPKVRKAAFDTLNLLLEFESHFKPLVKQLVNRKAEILMNEDQLPLILHIIFKKKSEGTSEQESKKLKAILDEFIAFISNKNSEDVLVALLLETLTQVESEPILKAACGVTIGILNEAAEKASTEKSLVLQPFKSIIIRNVLSRFTPFNNFHKVVRTIESCWQTLLKSLENHNVFLLDGEKQISLTVEALKSFNEELFAGLVENHKVLALKATIHSATFSDLPEVTSAVMKFFKSINIEAKLCANLLKEMIGASSDESHSGPIRRRSVNDMTATPETLRTIPWRCGITLLEYLQNKEEISSTQDLLGPLFDVLQKCLAFEEQSTVEYVKQLVLSCILHLCLKVNRDGKAKTELPASIFKVELVVKCIRGTPNPQTHHHALQLLSHTAKMVPDQVIHNMMDIFTFMGSSVVRHDDAYSFQIITNIITSIIPTLIKANENKTPEEQTVLVVPVLKVFCDIILDVPEHRRLPLYVKFINTLGAREYLWMFLTLVFEAQIITKTPNQAQKLVDKKSSKNESAVEFPKRIEIALALIKEFDCETILDAATKLISFVDKLPSTLENRTNLDKHVAQIFNPAHFDERQFRHFKYIILQYLNSLTSSSQFEKKIASLSESETRELKPYYQTIIIVILKFIPSISAAAASPENTKQALYWKVMLAYCYDILSNVISLCSANMLAIVVRGLLSHRFPGVRRKVIELLNNKLQDQTGFVELVEEENLLALLGKCSPEVNSSSISNFCSSSRAASKHRRDNHPSKEEISRAV